MNDYDIDTWDEQKCHQELHKLNQFTEQCTKNIMENCRKLANACESLGDHAGAAHYSAQRYEYRDHAADGYRANIERRLFEIKIMKKLGR